MIHIDQLTKHYSKDLSIGPISISLPKGELTGIIGPNGAGKSTLLKSMGRLIPIDHGQVTYGDWDIATTNNQELAKKIAILQQDNHLVTRLTVYQLVSFGRYPYSHGHINQEDQAIIQRYLQFLNLVGLKDKYLDELSGGQRQRAYVAMVLAQETDYILLDEPLNNLDISGASQMMNYLRECVDELGKTIVIVLHDINIAAQYSDSICALKDGKLAFHGKPDEVMTGQHMSELFDVDCQVIQGPKGPLLIY